MQVYSSSPSLTVIKYEKLVTVGQTLDIVFSPEVFVSKLNQEREKSEYFILIDKGVLTYGAQNWVSCKSLVDS